MISNLQNHNLNISNNSIEANTDKNITINEEEITNDYDLTNQNTDCDLNESLTNHREDEEYLYVTLDLTFEAVQKLKNLNLEQLNYLKQIGILGIQFENEDYFTSFVQQKELQNQCQQKLETNFKFLNDQTSNQTEQNTQSKKRVRKTIMELTQLQNQEIINQKIKTEANNLMQQSQAHIVHQQPQELNLIPAQIVLSSSIIEDPSLNQQYIKILNQSGKINTINPMLSNILSNEINDTNKPSLVLTDDLKNIYQIRNILTQKINVKQETEENKPKKKANRAPADPNKPKAKRVAKPKPNADLASQVTNEAQNFASQEQLKIRNILINSSNATLGHNFMINNTIQVNDANSNISTASNEDCASINNNVL